MIEFLKKLYEELYDLPNFYLGIEDGWKSHAFCAIFLILMVLSFIFIIKNAIEVHKSRRERMKSLKNIKKMLLRPFDEDLNKKKKNVR